jgi:hypothetical protein
VGLLYVLHCAKMRELRRILSEITPKTDSSAVNAGQRAKDDTRFEQEPTFADLLL